jgi:DNA-binding transcriptional ArsR family regulator
VKGKDCIGALKALGEENRLRILRLLLSGEQRVNGISEALGISAYNVSKHLGVLRAAGLITCRKDGRERVYSVAEVYRIQLSNGKRVMDLGCCSFRMEELPR